MDQPKNGFFALVDWREIIFPAVSRQIIAIGSIGPPEWQARADPSLISGNSAIETPLFWAWKRGRFGWKLCSSGLRPISDDFLKRLLASKFPADYTDQRYAITSASTEINFCETPTRGSFIGLCIDPGNLVARRALHCGEGQTNHAACLGNGVRLDLVAVYVIETTSATRA